MSRQVEALADNDEPEKGRIPPVIPDDPSMIASSAPRSEQLAAAQTLHAAMPFNHCVPFK